MRMYQQPYGYNSSMPQMVGSFNDLSISSRGAGGRGGPYKPRGNGFGGSRYPYRDDFRRDQSRDRQYTDEDDEEHQGGGGGGGGSYHRGGGNRGDFDNYGEHRGGYQNRGRGGYQPRGAYQPRGGGYQPRGGYQNNRGKFGGGFPPYGGGMDYPRQGGDWRGGFNGPRGGMGGMGGMFQERDDFYPVRVTTHLLSSLERMKKDWSVLQPRDFQLEGKLFKTVNKGEINFDNYKDIPVETSGNDLPPPAATFEDIDLGEIINNNIGLSVIKKPTPVQMYATSIVKQKRDLMACAQTGSGKTGAFLIPLLSRMFEAGAPEELKNGTTNIQGITPLALILAPTRELASQIFEMAQMFCYRSCVRPYVVYGGSNIDKSIEQLSLGVELLVATPGRLIDLLNRKELNLELIQYLVLDEADRMLDMGFEKDIRTIVFSSGMPGPGDRQTLMFSATFPKPIQVLAKDFMKDYIFLTVGRVGSTCDVITQCVKYIRKDEKMKELLALLEEAGEKERILVFVRTKADTDKIQNSLNNDGYAAISIHGNKTQRMRETALGQFRRGDKTILVATEVAARGLDIPNILHVINFDMPDTVDNYVHRIGRTGRMGNPGKATSFFCEADWHIAPGLLELLKESKQEVPQFLSRNKAMGQPPMKKNMDRFGGRDYRRGFTPVRMPMNNYSTNTQAPQYYNTMNPMSFNAVNYAPNYMQPAHHHGGNSYPQSNNSLSAGTERPVAANNSTGSINPVQSYVPAMNTTPQQSAVPTSVQPTAIQQSTYQQYNQLNAQSATGTEEGTATVGDEPQQQTAYAAAMFNNNAAALYGAAQYGATSPPNFSPRSFSVPGYNQEGHHDMQSNTGFVRAPAPWFGHPNMGSMGSMATWFQDGGAQ